MLDIKNLTVLLGNNVVLLGLNFNLSKGEICLVLGRNGSGKTSFANFLIGNKNYKFLGKFAFDGKSFTNCDELRMAKLGVYLAFQYPVEIPSVVWIHFLKLISNKLNLSFLKDKLDFAFSIFGLNRGILYKHVNLECSGGERKMFELIQMLVIEPKLCIFDEIDSGLDCQRLRVVFKFIQYFCLKHRSLLIITHNFSLINVLKPDSVYVMYKRKLCFFREFVNLSFV